MLAKYFFSPHPRRTAARLAYDGVRGYRKLIHMMRLGPATSHQLGFSPRVHIAGTPKWRYPVRKIAKTERWGFV